MSLTVRVLCLAALSLSTATQAVIHGQVTMTGQIQAPACGIDTEDVWQEVVFGRRYLKTRNDGLPVSLHLVDCQPDKDGHWQGVSVTFDGEPGTTSEETFAVQGPAGGISLRLTSPQGDVIRPGMTLDEPALPLQEDTLNYNLNVIRTAASLEYGEWSGFIRIKVEYK